MKDHLLQQVAQGPTETLGNRAREYLQAYLLRLIHEAGGFRHLAFLGDTALRLLHRLPRFSEDLDFATATTVAAGGASAPTELFLRLKSSLVAAGYEVTVKARTEPTVASAFFRFEGLPRLVGFSSDPRLALSVKVKIDTNPPAGAGVETTLMQRFFPIAVRHHDLPSLFAGKLHALLARPYPKGRDWYDLVWYRTEQRRLEPNRTAPSWSTHWPGPGTRPSGPRDGAARSSSVCAPTSGPRWNGTWPPFWSAGATWSTCGRSTWSGFWAEPRGRTPVRAPPGGVHAAPPRPAVG